MQQTIQRIYYQKYNERKRLYTLKNVYFGIIYQDCLQNASTRQLHRDLFNATIKSKKIDRALLGYFLKLGNKAKKIVARDVKTLSLLLLKLFNNKIPRKIINYNTARDAELKKRGFLDEYINNNRKNDRWFYLSSAHGDCAPDHVNWQGKIYVDANAPEDIIQYALKRKIYTIQWVTSDPVYFLTRPNCRHYFVGLTEDDVKNHDEKYLLKKYKAYRNSGYDAIPTISEKKDEKNMRKILHNIEKRIIR